MTSQIFEVFLINHIECTCVKKFKSHSHPDLKVFPAHEADVDVDAGEADGAELLEVEVEDVAVDGVEIGARQRLRQVLLARLLLRHRVVVVLLLVLYREGPLQRHGGHRGFYSTLLLMRIFSPLKIPGGGQLTLTFSPARVVYVSSDSRREIQKPCSLGFLPSGRDREDFNGWPTGTRNILL